MMASDLVKCLTRLIEKHGDHPVGFQGDYDEVVDICVIALAGHAGGDDVAYLLGDENMHDRVKAQAEATSG